MKQATINVSTEMDGQVRSMGSFKFRIRRVLIQFHIASIREGNIPKNLIASPIIIPNGKF